MMGFEGLNPSPLLLRPYPPFAAGREYERSNQIRERIYRRLREKRLSMNVNWQHQGAPA
jgi:hypothetical protein